MKLKLDTIAVIGAGAWGTALANVAAYNNRKVVLWARDAGVAADMEKSRTNERRLPGVRLAGSIRVTADAAELSVAKAVIVAVSSQHLIATLDRLATHLPQGVPAIVATKGFVAGADRDNTSIVARAIDCTPFALSGPSFAADVGRGLPAAVVLAGMRHGDVARLGNALGTPRFRIYFSLDMAGVQTGGAVKNVLAIGCGMCAGMRLGRSALAALVTRSSFELTRLGRAYGGTFETLQGLAGLGDLVLTATSGQSRNFSLGLALGEGKSLEEALAASTGVCEGVATAPEVMDLARHKKLDLPICAAVAAILAGHSTPAAQMEELLGRPLVAETLAQ